MRNEAEMSAVYLVVRMMMGVAAGLAFCVYAVVLAVMAVLVLPAAAFRAVGRLGERRTDEVQPSLAHTMRVDHIVIPQREAAETGVC